MKSYRLPFILALVGNLLLAAALLYFWLRHRPAMPAPPPQSSAPAVSTPQPSASPSMPAPPSSTEAPLTPVQISSQRLQNIGVTTGTVRRRFVENDLRTTGNVAVDETKLAYVQVRFSGYIVKVFADATYQYIRKGQRLFTIYSPELVATEREYLVAKQNQQMVAQSTVPGVASGAASLLGAAAERLAQWGVPRREILRLDTTGAVQQELEIDSPASGFITERNALPNLAVQPDTRLYTIAALSTVWVQAQLFQSDLAQIRIGDPALLTVDSYPGHTFTGRVDFIYPQVDMTTRTANVRVIFPNPSLLLKPGMFVNVELKAPLGWQMVVPASGVLQSGTRQVVFLDRGDGYLEPRDVLLGTRAGDDFIVLKGLRLGDRIVTSANFLIDSESQLQAALGSFLPPPPATSGTSAASAPSSNVAFTSTPDPPRKGANLFRVTLTTAASAPLAGAAVSLTFFMPAMPAMGMASMRVLVTLTEKAPGVYEGSASLPGGGTWQVSVLAMKNGHAVASKQLSVNVAGGM